MRIKGAKYFVEPGQRFGRLTVIREFNIPDKSGYPKRRVTCKCDCGNEITTNLQSIFKHTKSCGCYRKEYWRKRLTTHGCEYDPVFSIFKSMRSRCYSKSKSNAMDYQRYGGRGITICDEWLKNPALFVKWAYNNGYQKGITIERIDNNKGYSPENCVFADRLIQANNTRNNHIIELGGEKMSMADFCRKYDLNYGRFNVRLNKLKYSLEKAMINCGYYKSMNQSDLLREEGLISFKNVDKSRSIYVKQ